MTQEERKPRQECIEKFLSLNHKNELLFKDIENVEKEMIENREVIKEIKEDIEAIKKDELNENRDKIKAYKQRFFFILVSILSLLGGVVGFYAKTIITAFFRQGG